MIKVRLNGMMEGNNQLIFNTSYFIAAAMIVEDFKLEYEQANPDGDSEVKVMVTHSHNHGADMHLIRINVDSDAHDEFLAEFTKQIQASMSVYCLISKYNSIGG